MKDGIPATDGGQAFQPAAGNGRLESLPRKSVQPMAWAFVRMRFSQRVSLKALSLPCILVFAALFGLLPAHAASGEPVPEGRPTVTEAVQRVKAVYAERCCFRARFDQVTVNVAMDMRDRFQGTMYVKKPAYIALDVDYPEKQQVLLRGRQYEVYFPADGNAARGEIPPEIDVENFFGFFADVAKIDTNFSVEFPARVVDADEHLIFLELTDKRSVATTFRILLGIDEVLFTIRRAVIYDALGNYNRFDLSEITFLPQIPDSRFQSSPSHGGIIAPSDITPSTPRKTE